MQKLNIIFILFLGACSNPSGNLYRSKAVKVPAEVEISESEETEVIKYYANQFDFPVGKPDAEGYYNAQEFTKNNHLGEDWNANTGGNSDLGDPIYAIASGKVSYAQDHGMSWGNVIRVIHYLKDGSQVESLYAHCDKMLVNENDWIQVGDQIGTIGNADGYYPAHLHLELRETVGMRVGGGYSVNRTGFLDPTKYINAHRTIE